MILYGILITFSDVKWKGSDAGKEDLVAKRDGEVELCNGPVHPKAMEHADTGCSEVKLKDEEGKLEGEENDVTLTENVERDIDASWPETIESDGNTAETASLVSEEEVHDLDEVDGPDTSPSLKLLLAYFDEDSVVGNMLRAGLFASRSPDFLLFLSISFLMSASFAILSTYCFLFFSESLGASPALLGLCVLASVLTEVPFFYFSGTIIDTLGLQWTVALSLFLMSVRCAAYAIVQSAQYLPFLELFHGVIFGALYSSAMAYVDEHSPPSLKIAAQGLYKSVSHGLGGVVGNVVAGYVYASFGPRALFASLSAVVFAAFVCWAAMHARRWQSAF